MVEPGWKTISQRIVSDMRAAGHLTFTLMPDGGRVQVLQQGTNSLLGLRLFQYARTGRSTWPSNLR